MFKDLSSVCIVGHVWGPRSLSNMLEEKFLAVYEDMVNIT